MLSVRNPVFEWGIGNYSYRRHFENWIVHEGITPGRVVEMESYHCILAYVIPGAGIALMPRSTLETMPGRSSVNVFELAPPFRNINTGLFWRKEGDHDNVRALLPLLKAASPLKPTAAISSLPQTLDQQTPAST
ncbi:hypothetical protein EOL67_13930 [Pseudomonas syringae pv. syringae]|nr:hypothetical protein EOL67_13930 [Pseudomonas syringae pv. syringae]